MSDTGVFWRDDTGLLSRRRGICGGRVCIDGTRIHARTVASITGGYWTRDEYKAAYPRVNDAQVAAAVAWWSGIDKSDIRVMLPIGETWEYTQGYLQCEMTLFSDGDISISVDGTFTSEGEGNALIEAITAACDLAKGMRST